MNPHLTSQTVKHWWYKGRVWNTVPVFIVGFFYLFESLVIFTSNPMNKTNMAAHSNDQWDVTLIAFFLQICMFDAEHVLHFD